MELGPLPIGSMVAWYICLHSPQPSLHIGLFLDPLLTYILVSVPVPSILTEKGIKPCKTYNMFGQKFIRFRKTLVRFFEVCFFVAWKDRKKNTKGTSMCLSERNSTGSSLPSRGKSTAVKTREMRSKQKTFKKKSP